MEFLILFLNLVVGYSIHWGVVSWVAHLLKGDFSRFSGFGFVEQGPHFCLH